MSDLWEPIILEPAGLTPEQGWGECNRYVEKCGGVIAPDGEVNWRAAFGADPGICSCPACFQRYWAWGTKQRCRGCGFEYPTDWWPMYSYGVHWANRPHGPDVFTALHERRISHPYYRYGVEHPVEDPWKERDKINWREVMTP